MNDIQYGKFLNSIIRIADRKLSDSGGLARKYSIRPAGVDMVVSNLSEGWDAFEQMASEMKKGYLSWTNSVGTALAAVLMPQLGAALSGILRQSHSLNFWGGDEKAINAMYDNKSFIITVYQMGKRLHSRYIDAGNDEQKLQKLKLEAVNYLTDNH